MNHYLNTNSRMNKFNVILLLFLVVTLNFSFLEKTPIKSGGSKAKFRKSYFKSKTQANIPNFSFKFYESNSSGVKIHTAVLENSLTGVWKGKVYIDDLKTKSLDLKVIIKQTGSEIKGYAIQKRFDGVRVIYTLNGKVNDNKVSMYEENPYSKNMDLTLYNKTYDGTVYTTTDKTLISGNFKNDSKNVFVYWINGYQVFNSYGERIVKQKGDAVSGKLELIKQEEITKIPAGSDRNILISVDSLREKALNYYFGKPSFNEPACKQIIEQLVKHGDTKSQLWKCIFIATGSCGYAKDLDYSKSLYKKYDLVDLEYNQSFLQIDDPEAILIRGFIKSYGIRFPESQNFNSSQLNKLVENKIPLADIALGLSKIIIDKSPNDAQKILKRSYESGYNKAGYYLAGLYENYGAEMGFNIDSLAKIVLGLYTNLSKLGDKQSALRLAKIMFNTTENKRLQKEGLKILDSLKDLGSINAIKYLAEIELTNEDTIASLTNSITLLKKCRELGDKEVELKLGALYLKKEGINSEEGFKWIYEAAHHWNAEAMNILGGFYKVGTKSVEKDTIKSNYWLDIAVANGFNRNTVLSKKQTNTNINVNKFIDDWFDSKPTVLFEKKDNSGNVTSQSFGSDMGLMNSTVSNIVIPLLLDYLTKPLNETVNILEYVTTRISDDTTYSEIVYGGFLNNQITIKNIKEGDIIRVSADGELAGRMFDRYSPNGLGYSKKDQLLTDAEYSAIIVRFNEEKWRFCGHYKEFISKENGSLTIAVNTKNPKQNIGSFRFNVFVKSLNATTQ